MSTETRDGIVVKLTPDQAHNLIEAWMGDPSAIDSPHTQTAIDIVADALTAFKDARPDE